MLILIYHKNSLEAKVQKKIILNVLNYKSRKK